MSTNFLSTLKPVSSPTSGNSFLNSLKPASAPTTPPAPTTLEGKLRANPAYGSQVGAEEVAGVKKVTQSLKTGSEDIQKGANMQGKPGLGGYVEGLKGGAKIMQGEAENVFGTLTGLGQTAFAPVTPAISKILESISKQNPAIVKTDELSKFLGSASPKVDEFAKKHPNALGLLGDIINTALMAYGGGKAPKVAGAVDKSLTSKAIDTSLFQADKAAIKPIDKALENITPKINEVKDATLKQVLKTADPETTFTKGKINLSPNLKKAALDNTELLQGNPTQNYQAVVKKSSDLFKETNASVVGKKFEPKKLEANIEASANKITPPSTINANTWKNKITEIVDNILEQNKGGDASKLRQYILDYRKENQGALDALYGGGKEKSANKLIDNIEQAMNDTLAETNPTYAANIQKMKDLKQLSDWLLPISENSAKTSGVGKFIKAHPYATGTIGGSVLGASGYGVAKDLGLPLP